MSNELPEEGYFITGTDTGIGKTLFTRNLISELVERGHRVAAMKPVASGAIRLGQTLLNEDAFTLKQASNVQTDYSLLNPYCFAPAISPNLAADRESIHIDLDHLLECRDTIAATADLLVVEGVGGWRVPLSFEMDVADLVREFGYPTILIVGVRLGCINHALLTVDAIIDAGCRLTAWVSSGVDPQYESLQETIDYLCARIPSPYLGHIPHMKNPDSIDHTYIKPMVDKLILS